MSGPLTPIARAFLSAIRPMRPAIDDPGRMSLLLKQLGWNVAVSLEHISTLPFVASLRALLDSAEEIDLNLANNGSDPQLTVQLLGVVADIIDLITALRNAPPAGVSLPDPLGSAAFWEDFADELPDHLLVSFLERDHPILQAALTVLGVIDTTFVAAADNRGSYVRRRISWSSLGPALTDPVGQIAARYSWGQGETFEHVVLVRELSSMLRGLDISARLRPVSATFIGAGKPFATNSNALEAIELAVPLLGGVLPERGYVEAGIVVVPVPGVSESSSISRLLLTNLAWGELSADEQFSSTWILGISGQMSGTGLGGIILSPTGVEPYGQLASGDVSLTLTATPSTPWLLFGSDSGPRIELGGSMSGIAFRMVDGEPEVAITTRTSAPGKPPLSLRIDPADGDSFIASLLGTLALQVPIDIELRWSSRTGLTIGGIAGLALSLALDLEIGPITISRLTLELIPGSGDDAVVIDLQTGIDASAKVGPIDILVERVGIRVVVTDGDDNAVAVFGKLGLDIAFLPPTGLGLGIDLEGIITGGGYLSIAGGRYAGVAVLQMFGVGLTVIGIIETELPDDPNGWSMFLSVIADFTPVPLGFGFFLSGVGGFMGLHRTLDEIALAEGVRDGRIDSLLFPEDPLADAIRIISDIEDYFPTQQGTHAFGAMARIDWGVPALISAELGVVLVVPDFRIAVIGEIESILPVPEAPLIELHMGVVGYIDPAEATFWVTASIYDSRLVQYALSGDMAMYASLGDQPYFLLSVGGFHPDWTPPTYLPSTMRDLRRMTAAIDLGADLQVGLEAYFAITPNTLQFGAEVFAIAQMKKLGVDFSARGDFGFDVLVIFTPFSISADMDANVMIEAEGAPLVSAHVEVHLEGPDPWFGRATATFEFLGQPINFDVAFGGSIKNDAPDAIELWDQLEEALRLPESWSTPAIAASVTSETALRPLDELTETGLWLAPDGALELRQRVLPLNREIEVFGAYVPDGESRFDITGAGLVAGAAAERKSTEEWFAPAQFIDMSSLERLSAPSFEEMDAGMSLSASGLTVPTTQDDLTSVDLEFEELVLEDKTRKRERRPLPIERFGLEPHFAMNKPGGPTSRHTVRNVPSFRVKSTRYDVTDPYNASRIKRGGLYADAVITRRATSSTSSRARIMPTTAISEKVV